MAARSLPRRRAQALPERSPAVRLPITRLRRAGCWRPGRSRSTAASPRARTPPLTPTSITASAANWSPASVPNAASYVVNLDDGIGAIPTTITLDGDKTVGVLNFTNTLGGSYTVAQNIADTGKLILNNGTSAAAINVTGTLANPGSHTISA